MTSARPIAGVGAASTAIRAVLSAPGDGPIHAVVTHVGRRRAGLDVRGRLVVLEPRMTDATLPCTVLVPGLSLAELGGPELGGLPGTAVVVGGDAIAVPGPPAIRITRWWAPARVRPGCLAAQASSEPAAQVRDESLDDALLTALDVAADHLVGAAVDAATTVLASVLGRGPGSTPDADDMAAGALLAARALLPARQAPGVEAVGRQLAVLAPARTTALSAELLRFAALGMAAPAAVAAASLRGTEARDRLLALGATSGRATAAGIDAVRAAVRRAARQGRIAA